MQQSYERVLEDLHDNYRQRLTSVLMQVLSDKEIDAIKLTEIMKWDQRIVTRLISEGFRGFGSGQILRLLNVLGYQVSLSVKEVAQDLLPDHAYPKFDSVITPGASTFGVSEESLIAAINKE